MENENLERPNYYAIIPADVRYSDVSSSAKLLYGEITALANKTGTCWAGNKYFADLYSVSVDSITRWVKELEAAGFISTKINKVAGNKRYIRITDIPIRKNADTYPQKPVLNNNTSNNSINVELKGKELLVLVNKVLAREFRVLPERGVKKTLDAFSLVEIETALTALAQDDWHREKLKELKLEYFIRSTTIDKFLAIAKQKNIKPAEKAAEDDAEWYREQERKRKENENRDWGF